MSVKMSHNEDGGGKMFDRCSIRIWAKGRAVSNSYFNIDQKFSSLTFSSSFVYLSFKKKNNIVAENYEFNEFVKVYDVFRAYKFGTSGT